MENAIQHHLHKKIIAKQKLSGGFSFETWRVTLEDGETVVFRTAEDYLNSGNRMIVAGDIFQRERFFYETLNRSVAPIFPEVYVIDDTRKYYGQAFQIYRWVEGSPLDEIFDQLNETEQKRIYHQLGLYVGQMHNTRLELDDARIRERGPWTAYIAGRLEERLLPLMRKALISTDEVRTIKNAALSYETDDAFSFLHLDVRFPNIIYNKGELFIIDAENAEWGDPRFEWARLTLSGLLTEDFAAGYFEATRKPASELTSGPFLLYQMETVALLLNVFLYEVTDDQKETDKYMTKFKEVKAVLL